MTSLCLEPILRLWLIYSKPGLTEKLTVGRRCQQWSILNRIAHEMAGTKDYLFTPQDLLRLLTHYTDGEVPMDAECTDFLLNPMFKRVIGLMTVSDEWKTPEPLHLRYDSTHRVGSWAKNEGQDKMVWEQRAETPNRQN